MQNGYVDLVDLCKNGLVTAKGRGQSIEKITIEIVSRVNVPLRVSINHGTYFVSWGHHQNMITRRKYRFDLDPFGSARIGVPAACINATLPIPDGNDQFGGVARVAEKVRRFVEAAEREHAMVVQAGVWALTDGFSRERIEQTLRARSVSAGIGRPAIRSIKADGGPAISQVQMDRAREILDALGIRSNL